MNNPTNENISSFGIREFISFLFRLLVGVLFIYAAYGKIINPYSFFRSIQEYNLLPIFLVPLAAVILPWIEMLTGIFLVLGAFYRASGFIILCLMIIFETAIIINLIHGVNMDCGCGLPLDFLGVTEKLTWLTVLRDSVFIIMAIEITFFSHPKLALDQWFANRRLKKPSLKE
jgi:putative oxidoreductase